MMINTTAKNWKNSLSSCERSVIWNMVFGCEGEWDGDSKKI